MLPESIAVNLIEAREIDPPEGEEGAVWRLITTHDARCFEDARFLVALYRRRWTIEEFFRTVKTRGFDIERNRIAEEPFEKLVAAVFVAAMDVMQSPSATDAPRDRLKTYFTPTSGKLSKPSARRWRAKRCRKRTRTRKARWPMPPGCAPGLEVGIATTANPVPS